MNELKLNQPYIIQWFNSSHLWLDTRSPLPQSAIKNNKNILDLSCCLQHSLQK